MASNKKEEPSLIFPRSSKEDDAITDLRDALNRLHIPEEQQELFLMELFARSSSSAATAAASAVAAPSAVASVSTVPNLSAVTTVSTDEAAAAAAAAAADDDDDDDVDTTQDAYGDDDDDDDDSEYDGNVQYPYPKSKIQYDSEEDSVVDYQLSQQVSFN